MQRTILYPTILTYDVSHIIAASWDNCRCDEQGALMSIYSNTSICWWERVGIDIHQQQAEIDEPIEQLYEKHDTCRYLNIVICTYSTPQ